MIETSRGYIDVSSLRFPDVHAIENFRPLDKSLKLAMLLLVIEPLIFKITICCFLTNLELMTEYYTDFRRLWTLTETHGTV